jgi:hypothetical protein
MEKCFILFYLIYGNKLTNAIQIHDLEESSKSYMMSSEAQEYCRNKHGNISCWIGPEILSLQGEYYKAIKSKANADNLIILAFVDFSFVELAINLYEFSFRRLNIKNFLFVCSDEKCFKLLNRRGINCFLYKHDTNFAKPSDYGTAEFSIKVRIKMEIVTAAVMLGFIVFQTDVDVVFLKDPIPKLTSDVDLLIQDDIHELNSGFFVLRPTYSGVMLAQRALENIVLGGMRNQIAVNKAVIKMVKGNSLSMRILDRQQFPCGKVYFEWGKKMFSGDGNSDNDAYIVHNNWIYTKAAKIYRFKETGLWAYDEKQYYSSKSSKYLVYNNDIIQHTPKLNSRGHLIKRSMFNERAYLITAMTLGKLLDRIVVFPKFQCPGYTRETNQCSFNTFFNVRQFDTYFSHKYREHVFLSHYKVPDAITKSISPKIHIVNQTYSNFVEKNESKTIIVTKDEKNVLASDVISWFATGPLSEFSVLNFESLNFNILYENRTWWDTLNTALIFSNYEQFNEIKK